MNKSTLAPELLSHEAAELLGVAYQTVQTHRRAGNISGRKWGVQWLYTRSSIEAYKLRRKRGRPRHDALSVPPSKQ